jgi:hypothetical protein
VFIVRCGNIEEMSGSLSTLSHPENAGEPPTARDNECPSARMFIVYGVEMVVEL